jgi:hypothetical protein
MVAGGRKNTEQVSYKLGDEISYAFGSGLVYGEIVRLLEGGAAVEVMFEDGRREIKKARDRALHLVRRATGASELDEKNAFRSASRDIEIDEVRRSDIRKR